MDVAKLPYEVLIRFGADGEVRGAHVVWRYITRDGATVVSDQAGAAEPAGEAGADFPLAKAVGDAIAAGLVASGNAVASLESELKRTREELDAVNAQLAVANADLENTAKLIAELRDEHQARTEALSAELNTVRSLAGLATDSDIRAAAEAASRLAARREALTRELDLLDRVSSEGSSGAVSS